MKGLNLVVIVTHNSQKYIDWCVGPLINNELCDIVIVDSGSSDIEYLKKYESSVKVLYKKNIGFAKANNAALQDVERYKSVLFLNPDARVESKEYEKLIATCFSNENANFHFFSVPLISYDFDNKTERGFYDSLGIKCSFYGKWEDIRAPVSTDLDEISHYDAICGAFFLVKTDALLRSPNSAGINGFEESYYMYKEDIELSLRLKKNKFKSKLIPEIKAYHCRGWNNDRKKVPYWAKLYSARNDLDVALRYKWRAIPFSLMKFLYVKVYERKYS
ncbi:glycosyltransferase [Brenneria sp. 4F2]|nr:glycosyltransferase [Brenneria bubanii]